MSIKPAIIVHGGAGTFGSHGSSGFKVNDVLLSGVQDAAKAGYIYLINDEETASVVDAVEAAVCSLENNPLFNAGTVFSFVKICPTYTKKKLLIIMST